MSPFPIYCSVLFCSGTFWKSKHLSKLMVFADYILVVCASLDVASLDGTCSWAAAVAAAAHGVADARGMTMVGRRHVKSSPIGRAVATEESEGALGGHVSSPRGVGSWSRSS